jgi:hypothetical protein
MQHSAVDGDAPLPRMELDSAGGAAFGRCRSETGVGRAARRACSSPQAAVHSRGRESPACVGAQVRYGAGSTRGWQPRRSSEAIVRPAIGGVVRAGLGPVLYRLRLRYEPRTAETTSGEMELERPRIRGAAELGFELGARHGEIRWPPVGGHPMAAFGKISWPPSKSHRRRGRARRTWRGLRSDMRPARVRGLNGRRHRYACADTARQHRMASAPRGGQSARVRTVGLALGTPQLVGGVTGTTLGSQVHEATRRLRPRAAAS